MIASNYIVLSSMPPLKTEVILKVLLVANCYELCQFCDNCSLIWLPLIRPRVVRHRSYRKDLTFFPNILISEAIYMHRYSN